MIQQRRWLLFPRSVKLVSIEFSQSLVKKPFQNFYYYHSLLWLSLISLWRPFICLCPKLFLLPQSSCNASTPTWTRCFLRSQVHSHPKLMSDVYLMSGVTSITINGKRFLCTAAFSWSFVVLPVNHHQRSSLLKIMLLSQNRKTFSGSHDSMENTKDILPLGATW